MIGRYDDGALEKVISGEGTLTLRTEPAGAEVFLSRFVDQDGVLEPEEERSLGETPLGPIPLPMGSYLVTLRHPDFPEVRYPVFISRNRDWKGPVKFRTEDEISEDFVYVPGGPFVYGERKETCEKVLPDFAIARYPVTFAQYADFLASLPEEEAEERKPQTPGDGPYVERGEDGRYHPLPVIVEGKARERCLLEYGEGFEERIPVMAVSFDDAQAYCAWKSKETGKEWRLPTEEEREKAARGVDGRRFPWGSVQDSSLAKCRDSRDEDSQPEPVGTFQTAASVYGMGDAAGNVWDWTDSWFDGRRSLRVLRGGSWGFESAYLRCAIRVRGVPRGRLTNVGFRCARGLL